jgi:hypothetical protein
MYDITEMFMAGAHWLKGSREYGAREQIFHMQQAFQAYSQSCLLLSFSSNG